METKTETEKKLEMVKQAIEIAKPLLPTGATIEVTIKNCKKEDLEMISNIENCKLFQPFEHPGIPKYWLRLRSENPNDGIVIDLESCEYKYNVRELIEA